MMIIIMNYELTLINCNCINKIYKKSQKGKEKHTQQVKKKKL